MFDLTLASNCWEGNYEIVTRDTWAKQLFIHNCDDIKYRTLMISNVNNREAVEKKAEYLIDQGIIDEKIFSYDWISSIQNTFIGCDERSFIRRSTLKEIIRGTAKRIVRKKEGWVKPQYNGLVYSISPMASLILCKTEWLLYITEDVVLDSYSFNEWVGKAIRKMSIETDVIVANPIWYNSFQGAQEEAIEEDSDFYYSYGFSDQCCLMNVKRIINLPDIFTETNPVTERVYPPYGGNCFERRISAYMRNHDLKRITYKHSTYLNNTIR